MNDEQIKECLSAALSKLQAKDNWLLTKNLSEQSVSHKLAEYIQSYFGDYHVDCEYNGDVNDGKKHIQILYSQLEAFGLLKPRESQLEAEIIERAVFPDIIIHKRGSNADNLLIVELKKESSKVPFKYDNLKLKAYTSSDHGNHLKYQLGAFIVTNENGQYKIEYYKDGQILI